MERAQWSTVPLACQDALPLIVSLKDAVCLQLLFLGESRFKPRLAKRILRHLKSSALLLKHYHMLAGLQQCLKAVLTQGPCALFSSLNTPWEGFRNTWVWRSVGCAPQVSFSWELFLCAELGYGSHCTGAGLLSPISSCLTDIGKTTYKGNITGSLLH